MKFGIDIPNGWKMSLVDIKDPVEAYEAMTNIVTTGDELGYDSAWVVDHFHTVPTPTQEITFECMMMLAALARDTKNIRIGQIVLCNSYRNPALLAKMASTLDVLSHGRLNFGIGAGWYEHEYKAYGYPYPDAPERLRMLREALKVIHAMWSQEEAVFEGKYYQVRGAINQPKGVQKPHIPILIGGSGEKVGRNFSDIHVTTGTYCSIADTDEEALALVPEARKNGLADTALVGSPATIRERIATLEAHGVHELIIDFPFPSAKNLEPLRRFAKEFIHKL